MSVKDVLTSLVDDGLVDSDKIGTSVYFWAFPSKATQVRKRKIETSTENLETVGWFIYASVFTVPCLVEEATGGCREGNC